MTKSLSGQGRQPTLQILRAGGRQLRVAVWAAEAGSPPRRPLLFFNGIGANIELMAPLADWEPVFQERLMRMCSGDHPALPGYDEGSLAIDHGHAQAA